VSAEETTFSRLEKLCDNAGLRFQNNTSKMARFLDHHEFSQELRKFFEYFTDDPSAFQKEVHSVFDAMRDFREGFNESTALTTSHKKYILKNLIPELLLGILVGENESKLLGKKWYEITEPLEREETDELSKYRYDLAHTLYLHEDFALSISKSKHGFNVGYVGRFDLAEKLAANAKYLRDNSPFEEGYYYSTSFAVSLANAYLARVLASLRSRELWFESSYLDEFISEMSNAISFSREEGYIFGGLRRKCERMCDTVAIEMRKHKATTKNVRLYRLYREQLLDIQDFLRNLPEAPSEKKPSYRR
jgi:hypothetical protein